MTETEKAAINAMEINFTFQSALKLHPDIPHLVLEEIFKAGFLDGVLTGLQRVQSGMVKL